MSSKPASTCKIQKGLLLDAQHNFADTFNWIVSCWENLKGGTGIKVEKVSDGAPKISLNSNNVEIKPGDNTNLVFTREETDEKITIKVDLYYA